MFISIKNPTNEPRHGFVNIPWPMLRQHIDPQNAVTVKYGGRPLQRVQLDRINTVDPNDKDDDSLWELCVHIEYMEAGGYQTASPLQLEIESATHPPTAAREHARTEALPAVKVEDNNRRVTLTGERLVVFLQLPSGPSSFVFQGGSFTSIRLRGREILDAFGAERHPSEGHDPHKRLQLDAVALPNSPLSDEPVTWVKLFDRDWRYVTSGQGPARAWVVIESPTIEYPDANDPTLEGHLYRLISLYADADYLMEDIFVIGAPAEEKTAKRRISFAPHFFLKMNFDPRPATMITRVPDIPDWFTIATHTYPNQAYGFAATAPCGRFDNPPLNYPRALKDPYCAFGWELGLSKSVRCMHLFKRGISPYEAADETGRNWFDLIFKPPYATNP